MSQLDAERIGAKIKGLRAEHGMTLEELGEAARAHPNTIGSIERGETKRVDVFTLDKIAAAFGLTAEDLLSRSRGGHT